MGIEKEVLIAKLLEDKHITFKEALILLDQKSNHNINYNPYKEIKLNDPFIKGDDTIC